MNIGKLSDKKWNSDVDIKFSCVASINCRYNPNQTKLFFEQASGQQPQKSLKKWWKHFGGLAKRLFLKLTAEVEYNLPKTYGNEK